MNDCEIKKEACHDKSTLMDNISTKFSGLAQNCERRLVSVGTTMVGETHATERRAKNTAGEKSGCKTKHCWGSVSPSKSGPEPPLYLS